MQEVNQLIEELRISIKELGYTQRQLADMTGLKQPAIARMLTGGAIPRMDTFLKVAIAIGFTLEMSALSGYEKEER